MTIYEVGMLISNFLFYGGLFILIAIASKELERRTDHTKFKKRRVHIRY